MLAMLIEADEATTGADDDTAMFKGADDTTATFEATEDVTMTLEADDILASRVFKEGALDLDGYEGADHSSQ